MFVKKSFEMELSDNFDKSLNLIKNKKELEEAYHKSSLLQIMEKTANNLDTKGYIKEANVLTSLMIAVASNDFEEAENLVSELNKKNQAEVVFFEVTDTI